MKGERRGADAGRDAGGVAGPGGRSKVLRFRDFGWEGVDVLAYKQVTAASWRHVTRHALVGQSGEALPCHVRYFEVGPGGHTSFEKHEHEHVIVVLRGRGEVRLGDRREELGFGDVVYVAPDEPHQFLAAGGEPFGFICVVPGERDRPRPL